MSKWIWPKTTFDHHIYSDRTEQRIWSKFDDKRKSLWWRMTKDVPSLWSSQKNVTKKHKTLTSLSDVCVVVSLHRLLLSWHGACSVASSWLPTPVPRGASSGVPVWSTWWSWCHCIAAQLTGGKLIAQLPPADCQLLSSFFKLRL